jgi:hypothetical protein
MKKILLIVSMAAFSIIFMAAIYFAVGISSVYDPIKKYEYHGSVNQLIMKINFYSLNNHNVVLEFEDTTGDIQTGYAYYYDVTLKANGDIFNYDLKFEDVAHQDQSEISLVGAHDPIHKLGGYRIKDTGVKQLLYFFENNFIDSLNDLQCTDIKVNSNN